MNYTREIRTGYEIRTWPDGHKEWHSTYEGTCRHREDGPAFEDVNGERGWWIKGVLYLNEEEWLKEPEVKKALLRKKIENILE